MFKQMPERVNYIDTNFYWGTTMPCGYDKGDIFYGDYPWFEDGYFAEYIEIELDEMDILDATGCLDSRLL